MQPGTTFKIVWLRICCHYSLLTIIYFLWGPGCMDQTMPILSPKESSFSILYERQRTQPSLSAHQTPISKEKMYVASKNLAFLLLVLFPFFISLQPCTRSLLIFYCFSHLWLSGNAMNFFAKVQTLGPKKGMERSHCCCSQTVRINQEWSNTLKLEEQFQNWAWSLFCGSNLGGVGIRLQFCSLAPSGLWVSLVSPHLLSLFLLINTSWRFELWSYLSLSFLLHNGLHMFTRKKLW